MALLEKLLVADAANPSESAHDFGKNIIPPTHRQAAGVRLSVHRRQDARAEATGATSAPSTPCTRPTWSWCTAHPELNIYDEQWPIWTYQAHQPPAKFVLNEDGRRGMAVNSMVSGGCIISGAYVTDSLLSTEVRIDEGSRIESSVLLPGVTVGRNCHIRRCIMDELCVVPDGLNIGIDPYLDAQRFYVTEGGVVLVTPDMLKALE